MAPKEDLANNYYMPDNISTPYPVIVSILKRHKLAPALTKTVEVSDTYVRDLWNTLEVHPQSVDEDEYLRFKIIQGTEAVHRLRFDLEMFRRTIGFPLENAYPNKNKFDPIPPVQTMIEGINSLGYEGEFTTLTGFNKKLFSSLWCTLYTIINRCFTPTPFGLDDMKQPIVKAFYGIAFNKHFDYAKIFWDHLVKIVQKKEKYTKYVPFVRFLAIILDDLLDQNPQIPSLDDDMHVELTPMRFVQQSTGSLTVRATPIPEQLLSIAHRSDPEVKRYREIVARMGPAEPQVPDTTAHKEPSEGSSMKGSKQKKSEGKRKEGDVGDTNVQTKRIKIKHPTLVIQPTAPAPTPSTTKPRIKSVHKKSSSKKVLETVLEEMIPSESESDPIMTTVPESHHHTDLGHDDSAHLFDDTTIEMPEVQGGNEGGVENLREDEWSGYEKRSKEKADLPKTSPKSLATHVATETHSLRQGIEKAVSSLLTQAQTLPSHSISQQRDIVSSVHGDTPHDLPASPSELQGIEPRDKQPLSRLSTHARMSSTPRTQYSESTSLRDFAHLSDVAGTNVGTTLSVVSQGSLGNPTSVNTVPALSVGHTTRLSDALVVSTERLSGTGVSFTMNSSFQSHFDSLTRGRTQHSSMAPLYTSRTQVTTPLTSPIIMSQTQTQSHPQSQPTQSQPQSQPSPSTSQPNQPQNPSSRQRITWQNTSLDDVRTMYHTKLLAAPSLSPLDLAMLSILNTHSLLKSTPQPQPSQPSQPSQNQPQPSQPQTDLTPILNKLEQIEQRLSSLESCRPPPTPFPRHQDDPDSQGPEEGEIRGSGSSFPQFSNVKVPQGSGEGTSHTAGGGNQDDQGFDYTQFEEEWEQPEPLNMIMPALMIGWDPMTVEKPEDDCIFQEKVSVPTREELESYLSNEVSEEEEVVDMDAGDFPDDQSSTPERPPGFEHGFNQESYDNIHSPEEVVLRVMHSVLCQGSSTFENSFFKDKSHQLNLKEKQMDRILEAPFIEEQAFKIFSNTDFTPRTYNDIGEKAFREDLRFYYRGSMRRMLNEPPLVVGQLKHKITIITQVECKRLCKINLPIIHVFRADGLKYQFNEAHFHLLHLEDIMDMYSHFRDAVIRPVEMIIAMNAVNRFIKYSIQAACKEDFQLGLESVQRKVHLTLPNQSVPESIDQKSDFCTVVTNPTPGFIFMNGDTQRNFIRLSELHKYSDGTLSLARRCFRWMLKNQKASPEQIPLIKQAMKLILGRLKFRVAMRQFEAIQGLRGKSIFQGTPVVKKYQPRIIKGSYARGGPFLPNDPRNKEPERL